MKDLMIRHVSVDQIENGVEIILKIEKKKNKKLINKTKINLHILWKNEILLPQRVIL